MNEVPTSCQRRPARTPLDHQISTAGRCNVSLARTDPNPTCYEGDSEEGNTGGDCGPAEESNKLHVHLSVDSTPCVLHSHPHSKQSRLHTTGRYHRGCIWGDGEKVTLLVDGKRFIISPTLLIKHPNTMLGRYVQSFPKAEYISAFLAPPNLLALFPLLCTALTCDTLPTWLLAPSQSLLVFLLLPVLHPPQLNCFSCWCLTFKRVCNYLWVNVSVAALVSRYP
jgi:hypothetical protein